MDIWKFKPGYEDYFPCPPIGLRWLYTPKEELEKKLEMKKKRKRKRGEKVEPIGIGSPWYMESPVFESEAPDITKQKNVNVISFLSEVTRFLVDKNGRSVSVEKLNGKYVLLCAFQLPLDNSCYMAEVCRAISYFSYEMSATGQNCKVVLAAKVTSKFERDHEAVVQRSFSGFLGDWLAIPVSDLSANDYVCNSLQLNGGLAALGFNPHGDVFQVNPYRLYMSGAAYFPFTPDLYDRLVFQDHILKCRIDLSYKEDALKRAALEPSYLDTLRRWVSPPASVADVLQCESLEKIDDPVFEDTWSLQDKPVGLYLCYDGRFLNKLIDIHQQCSEKGSDQLVIVVVCLAFRELPSSFFNHIKLYLKMRGISSWLVFPYNDKICRTLYRLSGNIFADSLIILPWRNESGEIDGKTVMTRFGMKAYPFFTREFLLNKNLTHLQTLTLESLRSSQLRRINANKDLDPPFSWSHLEGKNVLVYLGDFAKTRILDLLHDRCPVIVDYELVFVPLNGVPTGTSSEQIAETIPYPHLPWLVFLGDAALLCEKLFLKDLSESPRTSLIAFDKHGNIVSRHASRFLHPRKNLKHLFEDNNLLREELLDDISEMLAP